MRVLGVFGQAWEQVFLFAVVVGVDTLDEAFGVENEICNVCWVRHVRGLQVDAIHGANE